ELCWPENRAIEDERVPAELHILGLVRIGCVNQKRRKVKGDVDGERSLRPASTRSI
ncbi:MAG: hypothetical protein QOJ99_4068, partial [Bryobacterales bacterium]|nr:hypothetical protein [Bryobacterales bacterium]